MHQNQKEIKMKRYLSSALIFISSVVLLNCGTVQKSTDINSSTNQGFLKPNKKAKEVFRILLTSDNYIVSQMKYAATITRTPDTGGDKYMCSEVKKLDKIDEVREGLLSLWLYPDSGRIMKIRTQQSTYLLEVDKLLSEDIQRWNFTFPKKIVEPTRFDIKYRVILRKTLSDAEIIREVREKMKESH